MERLAKSAEEMPEVKNWWLKNNNMNEKKNRTGDHYSFLSAFDWIIILINSIY